MSVIFGGMGLFSFVTALFHGTMPQLSEAILSESGSAVELVVKILGSICLWSGVMEVAEQSGITGKFCPNCGKPKPAPAPAAGSWTCSCGATATGKFCPECGARKPEAPAIWDCPCGAKNITSKFCPECGKPKA